jgi:beta-galactosidase
MATLRLTRSGLGLGDETVPLLAGSVHYWRLAREDWRPCLSSVRRMGLRLVDVYVPWGVHEVAPGELDLGQRDARKDVGAFLDLVAELDLLAIVRPGPHINAELTYFGLPERVVWDSACQARGPRGTPVILPAPPRMFPVPSYASEAYHDEVTRYFHLLGKALAPRCRSEDRPDAPIVLLQIDNEGALFFRDGVYEQDYHPDAIAGYRAFLRERYGTITALREVYGAHARREPLTPEASDEDGEPEGEELRFSNILPPDGFSAESLDQMAYYLDWAAFQEQILATSLGKFREAMRQAGFGDLPTTHNFPLAEDTTPLNAAKVEQVVDLIGYDYYHRASPETRASVAARTSELSVRSEARNVPAFACEMGAGYPPYFPPLDERDSMFTVLCALAYGLRGFNVYMAVERDRWVGAPIGPHGQERPFADFWRRLCRAIEEQGFHHLTRRVPVRVLVPRVERRIARVMHALGPASGALMAVMGQGPREGCLEHELGVGYPLALQADDFRRTFEQALEARGVPYALVGGEDPDFAKGGAAWVVCATGGGFSDVLAQRLADAASSGIRVSMGPRARRWDGILRPLGEDVLEAADIERIEGSSAAVVGAAVSRAVESLGLPTHPCEPDGIHATVHENDAGQPRVVFVINPTQEDVGARIALGIDGDWQDLLGEGGTTSSGGVLELRIKPRTVRMLGRR